jgi:membrane protein
VFREVDRKGYLTDAGALSFFFLLSLFPLLIFLASALAYMPIPGLFEQILVIMNAVVPADAMGVIRGVLQDVLQQNPQLLSVSIVSAVFAASGGFGAMMTALNRAYNVREGRPYWEQRLIAIGLTILAGAAAALGLIAIAAGPQVANWLAANTGLGWRFVTL